MNESWNPRPGDAVVRRPRLAEISPVTVTITERRMISRTLSTPVVIIGVFALLIAIGTALLMMPFSHQGEGFVPFIVALFTATSAVTVTGLVIQDTATYWTRTGQAVILIFMFVGGLGFMTLATFFIAILGQRVSIAQRLLVRETFGLEQLGGLRALCVAIVSVAVGIQVVGFGALFIKFLFYYQPAEAVWQALFHSVSAFNNAGFVGLTDPEGLRAYRHDLSILGVIAFMILLGSLSYWVMADIARRKKFSRLTLTSKLIVSVTAIMIIVGSVGFLASEYNNPETIGRASIGQKVMISVFESISGRTAGFTTVDYAATRDRTNFFFSAMMFVGGAPGSVAGGIKVTTFAILVLGIVATVRDKAHVTAFRREVTQLTIRRAMAMAGIAFALIFIITTALISTQSSLNSLDLYFEAVSAFGTVGLSAGITPEISDIGHVVLIVAMFVGRIGPLLVGLSMIASSERPNYRYPRERVTIG